MRPTRAASADWGLARPRFHVRSRQLEPKNEVPVAERIRITKRRIEKAEKDERMDISRCLTPQKIEHGGFTLPTEMRVSKWWPGGMYLKRQTTYEPPVDDAYTPHTTFIFASAHKIKFDQPGRVVAEDFQTATCKESNFLRLVARYNSAFAPAPARKAMDQALWPWDKQPAVRPVRWWKPGEDPAEIRAQALRGDDMPPVGETEEHNAPDDDDLDVDQLLTQEQKQQRKAAKAQSEHAAAATTASPTQSATTRAAPARIQARALCTWSARPMSIMQLPLLHHRRRAYTSPSPGHREDERGPFEEDHDAQMTRVPPHLARIPPHVDPIAPHLAAVPHAKEVKHIDDGQSQAEKIEDPSLTKRRARYRATLQKTPFYRPLIAVTFPSRPIAMVATRLALSQAGRPFHSVFDTHDRKSRTSFPQRVLQLRVRRLLALTVHIAKRLRGWYGGLVGARYNASQRGFGAGAGDLAAPLPPEAQHIVARFGAWHPHAREWVEELLAAAREYDCQHVEARLIDEWGYDLDEHGERLPGQPSQDVLRAQLGAKEFQDDPTLWEDEDEDEDEDSEGADNAQAKVEHNSVRARRELDDSVLRLFQSKGYTIVTNAALQELAAQLTPTQRRAAARLAANPPDRRLVS